MEHSSSAADLSHVPMHAPPAANASTSAKPQAAAAASPPPPKRTGLRTGSPGPSPRPALSARPRSYAERHRATSPGHDFAAAPGAAASGGQDTAAAGPLRATCALPTPRSGDAAQQQAPRNGGSQDQAPLSRSRSPAAARSASPPCAQRQLPGNLPGQQPPGSYSGALAQRHALQPNADATAARSAAAFPFKGHADGNQAVATVPSTWKSPPDVMPVALAARSAFLDPARMPKAALPSFAAMPLQTGSPAGVAAFSPRLQPSSSIGRPPTHPQPSPRTPHTRHGPPAPHVHQNASSPRMSTVYQGPGYAERAHLAELSARARLNSLPSTETPELEPTVSSPEQQLGATALGLEAAPSLTAPRSVRSTTSCPSSSFNRGVAAPASMTARGAVASPVVRQVPRSGPPRRWFAACLLCFRAEQQSEPEAMPALAPMTAGHGQQPAEGKAAVPQAAAATAGGSWEATVGGDEGASCRVSKGAVNHSVGSQQQRRRAEAAPPAEKVDKEVPVAAGSPEPLWAFSSAARAADGMPWSDAAAAELAVPLPVLPPSSAADSAAVKTPRGPEAATAPLGASPHLTAAPMSARSGRGDSSSLTLSIARERASSASPSARALLSPPRMRPTPSSCAATPREQTQQLQQPRARDFVARQGSYARQYSSVVLPRAWAREEGSTACSSVDAGPTPAAALPAGASGKGLPEVAPGESEALLEMMQRLQHALDQPREGSGGLDARGVQGQGQGRRSLNLPAGSQASAAGGGVDGREAEEEEGRQQTQQQEEGEVAEHLRVVRRHHTAPTHGAQPCAHSACSLQPSGSRSEGLSVQQSSAGCSSASPEMLAYSGAGGSVPPPGFAASASGGKGVASAIGQAQGGPGAASEEVSFTTLADLPLPLAHSGYEAAAIWRRADAGGAGTGPVHWQAAGGQGPRVGPDAVLLQSGRLGRTASRWRPGGSPTPRGHFPDKDLYSVEALWGLQDRGGGGRALGKGGCARSGGLKQGRLGARRSRSAVRAGQGPSPALGQTLGVPAGTGAPWQHSGGRGIGRWRPAGSPSPRGHFPDKEVYAPAAKRPRLRAGGVHGPRVSRSCSPPRGALVQAMYGAGTRGAPALAQQHQVYHAHASPARARSVPAGARASPQHTPPPTASFLKSSTTDQRGGEAVAAASSHTTLRSLVAVMLEGAAGGAGEGQDVTDGGDGDIIPCSRVGPETTRISLQELLPLPRLHPSGSSGPASGSDAAAAAAVVQASPGPALGQASWSATARPTALTMLSPKSPSARLLLPSRVSGASFTGNSQQPSPRSPAPAAPAAVGAGRGGGTAAAMKLLGSYAARAASKMLTASGQRGSLTAQGQAKAAAAPAAGGGRTGGISCEQGVADAIHGKGSNAASDNGCCEAVVAGGVLAGVQQAILGDAEDTQGVMSGNVLLSSGTTLEGEREGEGQPAASADSAWALDSSGSAGEGARHRPSRPAPQRRTIVHANADPSAVLQNVLIIDWSSTSLQEYEQALEHFSAALNLGTTASGGGGGSHSSHPHVLPLPRSHPSFSAIQPSPRRQGPGRVTLDSYAAIFSAEETLCHSVSAGQQHQQQRRGSVAESDGQGQAPLGLPRSTHCADGSEQQGQQLPAASSWRVPVVGATGKVDDKPAVERVTSEKGGWDGSEPPASATAGLAGQVGAEPGGAAKEGPLQTCLDLAQLVKGADTRKGQGGGAMAHTSGVVIDVMQEEALV